MRLSRGVRAMLLSAFALSTMSALVKVAGQRLPSVEIALVRAAISLVLSWVSVRRAGVSPWGEDRCGLLMRGIAGFVGLHCYFYAVTVLPLADATVIHLTSPLFVAAMAALWLREPIRSAHLVAMMLGLAGVILVSRPSFLFKTHSAALPALGLAAAITSAVAGASAYVLIRKLRATEHPQVVVLHFPLLAVPLTIPIAAPIWVWPTPLEWLILMGVGLATQVGQVKMTEALQLEPAARVSAISYVQIFFAIGLGFAFFGEIPTPATVAGALAIVAGTAIAARPIEDESSASGASRSPKP
jgi:drug/metabolite transporter (DMT)-like permease